jgi:hypothetical protein
MRGRSLFRLLLTPSVLSSVSVIVVAAVLLSASDVYYFAHDSLIYDYLFGPHGQITILEEGASGVSAIFAALFSQPLGYDVLVFLGALIVGFMMYIILQVSSRGFLIVISTLLNVSLAKATTKKALEMNLPRSYDRGTAG